MVVLVPYTPTSAKCEYTFAGEWFEEEDLYTGEAHGLPYAVMRHPSFGNFCGYVGVPETHPLYGKSYSDEVPGAIIPDARIGADVGAIPALLYALGGDKAPRLEMLLHCHGGLTYSGTSKDNDYHWFGFDAGHSGDLQPAMPDYDYARDGAYCNAEYMIGECQRLAQQLAEQFSSHSDGGL